jgi:hypothetical protein
VERRDALTDFAARILGVRGRAKLDATAAEVFAAFAAADVDALLLKGPALARMLYAEGESRGYSDVDVLVAPGDLDRARAALAQAGFADLSEALGIDDVGGVVHDETWVGPDPEGHQSVDLHLRLPGAAAPAQRVWDALSARRTAIELAGRAIPVLRREGLALHVALHAAQHGAAHAKGIVDLQLALERWPEEVWRAAAALATEIDAARAFASGLRQVGDGARLAERLELAPASAPDARERPRGTFHLQALSGARGPRARARILRRALLPRRAWIVYTYPWARGGGPLLAAAYAVHLARAPLWAARAWRYRRTAG